MSCAEVNCLVGWCLMSQSTHYRSFRGRFLQARWPSRECQSTERNHLVVKIRFESHQNHSTMCVDAVFRTDWKSRIQNEDYDVPLNPMLSACQPTMSAHVAQEIICTVQERHHQQTNIIHAETLDCWVITRYRKTSFSSKQHLHTPHPSVDYYKQ